LPSVSADQARQQEFEISSAIIYQRSSAEICGKIFTRPC
jgi:hypothetical protein